MSRPTPTVRYGDQTATLRPDHLRLCATAKKMMSGLSVVHMKHKYVNNAVKV